MHRIAFLLSALAMGGCFTFWPATDGRILVFSKTEGFRHDSIEDGVAALRQLGERHGFTIDHTEDASWFTPDELETFDAVVFLNTTGDVLNEAQQTAFQAYIEDGGGFVGVHAAADTEYDWPWYGTLVGAYFESHPSIQQATISARDTTHPATRDLPTPWLHTDEWYNFRQPVALPSSVVLLLDESSYDGGTMNGDHPIAWYRYIRDGRSFYTGLGHTRESYTDSMFLSHLGGAVCWSAQLPCER